MLNKEMVLGATGYQHIASRKDKKRTTTQGNLSDLSGFFKKGQKKNPASEHSEAGEGPC